MKTFIHYLDPGPLPAYIGFAPDEKAFRREMKRLGVENIPPFTRSDGTTHLLRKDGILTCIVCVRKREDLERESLIGILVHEAVHVWQAIRDNMNEEAPSPEFEAYTVQHIAQWLVRHACELG